MWVWGLLWDQLSLMSWSSLASVASSQARYTHTHKLPITTCRYLLPFNRNRCFTSSVCKFSPQPISLSWWPLFRDAIFYILSVVVLILVRNSLKPLAKTDLVLDVSHVWKDTKMVSQTAEKDTRLRWEEGHFHCFSHVCCCQGDSSNVPACIKHASIERNIYIYILTLHCKLLYLQTATFILEKNRNVHTFMPGFEILADIS